MDIAHHLVVRYNNNTTNTSFSADNVDQILLFPTNRLRILRIVFLLNKTFPFSHFKNSTQRKYENKKPNPTQQCMYIYTIKETVQTHALFVSHDDKGAFKILLWVINRQRSHTHIYTYSYIYGLQLQYLLKIALFANQRTTKR